jgi:ADP-ribose pyrophosphatase YjhB (NUDIX family)
MRPSRISADTLPPMSRSVPACPHCATAEEQPLICDRGDAEAEPSVLLLKRAVEPGYGAWDLPAGYLDPGESFEMAARRETLEESGIEVTLIGLHGVYHSAPANAVTAIFRARAVDATSPVLLDAESSEHAWVPRSELDHWLPRIAFGSMASALVDWARTGTAPASD